MKNNKNVLSKYYKYIFLIIIIIIAISLIFIGKTIYKMLPKNQSNSSELISEDDSSPTIEIKDLDKYDACIIYGGEPYYGISSMTVSFSVDVNLLGQTCNSFTYHSNDIYYDIDGAVYNFDENLYFYSWAGNDDFILVDSPNSIGYVIFTKNYKNYVETCKFDNINLENQIFKLYDNSNIIDPKIFDTISGGSLINNKNIKQSELEDLLNETDLNFDSYILSYSNDVYNYFYMFEYDSENKHAYIYDVMNDIYKELDFDMDSAIIPGVEEE